MYATGAVTGGTVVYSPPDATEAYAGSEVDIWTTSAIAGRDYDIRFHKDTEVAPPPCGPQWLRIGPEEDDRITSLDGRIPQIGGVIPADTLLGEASLAFMDILTAECLPPVRVDVKQRPPCNAEGGLFKDFNGALALELKGCERHHMPSKASQESRYPHRCSPTILMLSEDHRLTGSWGGFANSFVFRDGEKQLIDQGTFEGYVQAFEKALRMSTSSSPAPAARGRGASTTSPCSRRGTS